MINSFFFRNKDSFSGFEIDGHANFDQSGRDIVCAGVSSCAIMAANTVTDVIKSGAYVVCEDGKISLSLCESNTAAQAVIEGLYLHLTEIALSYPKNITIAIRED